MVESSPNELLFIARANDVIDGLGALLERKIGCGRNVTTRWLVSLRAQRGQVLLIDWRNPRELLSLLDGHAKRLVIKLVGRSRATLFVNPDGDRSAEILAAAACREA